MPLIKFINKNNFTCGIWAITESVNTLLGKGNFNENEKTYLEKIKNINRKKQSIASKLILNKISNKKINVYYNKFGAPFCKKIKNISISHSNNLSAALISNEKIGIDIQYRSKKIQLIKNKFVNEKDLNHSFEEDCFLHYVWCSKEAIYKTLNGLPCSFKKHIFIKNLNENESLGLYIRKNKKIKFRIYHEIFEDYFISIANKIQ